MSAPVKHLVRQGITGPEGSAWIAYCGMTFRKPEKVTRSLKSTTCVQCQKRHNRGRVAGQSWTEYAAAQETP
jgi:hypothetical protein